MNRSIVFHAAAASCVALFLVVGDAHAHPEIDAARRLVEQGDFRGALEKLDRAEREPALTDDERVDLYWQRAVIQHALGDVTAAEEDMDRTLRLRPLWEPNKRETPPELRALFKTRVDAFQKRDGVVIGQPAVQGASLQVPLRGKVENAAQMVLYIRPMGGPAFDRYEFPVDGGKVTAAISDVALWKDKASGFETVVELRNTRGVALARLGDAVQPVTVPVSAAQKKKALALLEKKPPTVVITAVKADAPSSARDFAAPAPPLPPPPAPEPVAAAPSTPPPPVVAPAPEPSGSRAGSVLLTFGGGFIGLGLAAAVASVMALASAVGGQALTYVLDVPLAGETDNSPARPFLIVAWNLGYFGSFALAAVGALLVVTMLASGATGVVAIVASVLR